jgi:hypothetical protein
MAAETKLKVSWHGSGRYTLQRRDPGERVYKDQSGALFGNTDAGSFYRAVARLLAALAREGVPFVYQDTALDKRGSN